MGGTVKKAMTFWNPLQMPLYSNNSQTLPILRTDLKMVKQQIYGVKSAESNNILNGGKPGPHLIIGNGVGFKPNILDMDIMERVLERRIKILLEEAHDWKLSTACRVLFGQPARNGPHRLSPSEMLSFTNLSNQSCQLLQPDFLIWVLPDYEARNE